MLAAGAAEAYYRGRRDMTVAPESNRESLVLPSELQAELQAAADDEQRPAVDVLRDALTLYRQSRRLLHSSDHDRGVREFALPGDDVPLTPEYRQIIRGKIAAGMQSLREGKGTDGETFFARLEAEFDELERQQRR